MTSNHRKNHDVMKVVNKQIRSIIAAFVLTISNVIIVPIGIIYKSAIDSNMSESDGAYTMLRDWSVIG